jgi:hypothetical protein
MRHTNTIGPYLASLLTYWVQPIVGQPLVAGDGPDERHQRRNMFAMAIPTLVVPQ